MQPPIPGTLYKCGPFRFRFVEMRQEEYIFINEPMGFKAPVTQSFFKTQFKLIKKPQGIKRIHAKELLSVMVFYIKSNVWNKK